MFYFPISILFSYYICVIIEFNLMNISDEMLLKRFGLRVHPSYVEEVAKTIREDPAIKKYVDKILNSLGTMTNEDNLIDVLLKNYLGDHIITSKYF